LLVKWAGKDVVCYLVSGDILAEDTLTFVKWARTWVRGPRSPSGGMMSRGPPIGVLPSARI